MDKSIELSVKQIDIEIASKTTLIYSLANIQEGYVADIISLMQHRDILTNRISRKAMYKFDIKRSVDNIHKSTVLFRDNLNSHYKDNEIFKEQFGESTDALEDAIKDLIKDKVKWTKMK